MNNRLFFDKIFKNSWHKRTSDFGWRTYTYAGKKVTDFHVGVDEATDKSKPLYPPEYAYVTKISKDSTSGNFVYFWCAGVEMFYCHLASVNVKVGDTLHRDHMVGMAGSTGHSTGTHLHFGIKINGKWVNPDKWIAEYQAAEPVTKYINTPQGLNVREKPSILSRKITALKDNAKVIVYMTYKGWSYIGYGWVKSEYLSTKR